MNWREPQNYDDWDRIAEALYQSFVADAILFAEECDGWPPLIKYNRRISEYKTGFSCLYDKTEGRSLPFICFETHEKPFDICLFACLNFEGKKKGEFRKPYSTSHFQAAPVTGGDRFAENLTVLL